MKPFLIGIKDVTIITTMNTSRTLYQLIFDNALKNSLTKDPFWKLGYKNRKWISLNMVKSVSVEKCKTWLIEKRISNTDF